MERVVLAPGHGRSAFLDLAQLLRGGGVGPTDRDVEAKRFPHELRARVVPGLTEVLDLARHLRGERDRDGRASHGVVRKFVRLHYRPAGRRVQGEGYPSHAGPLARSAAFPQRSSPRSRWPPTGRSILHDSSRGPRSVGTPSLEVFTPFLTSSNERSRPWSSVKARQRLSPTVKT